ncbi:NAD(P)/FAD-dependent oxidoreductase [Amycolatopsis acidicola]|uniref:NAD(P)/FAD-dependent oxidoreductase n=1 Tax=Amycolatopsis acidicola TaxID=2596893 RepID=UPI001AA07BC7|nr:FAD-dependent oxidoreductase [Amycolatopsis acidicola]
MQRIVVVGASLAGLRCTEALRAEGFGGEVVLVGEERHGPYNRPPLSKAVLAGAAGGLELETTGERAAEWRLGVPATEVSLAARRLQLADGGELGYDGLVVATGLRPRRLPLPGPRRGRHVVRTLDDARNLAAALRPGARVTVLGASFIACEIASVAVDAGCSVTIVAPEAEPMAAVLGAELGAALRRRHEARGVEFRLGTVASKCDGGETLRAVVLSDGTDLPTDLLVEAVGCTPAVDWLEDNGLDLSDGVLCDNRLRVQGHEDVVAAGDVARFPNPLIDDVPRRVEHWTMAVDTARQAALTLLGRTPGPAGFRPLPGFWSDQAGLRIQAFGSPALADAREVVAGDLDGDVAIACHRTGRLIGAVAIGRRRDLIGLRKRLLDERSPLATT